MIDDTNATQQKSTQHSATQHSAIQQHEQSRPRGSTDKSTLRSARRPARRPARRSGKSWSGADVARLTVMAERQMQADRIARKLQRSEGAVRAEAARRRIRLAQSEKQPFGGVSVAGAAPAIASELQSAVSSRTPARRNQPARQNQAARQSELTESLF